MRKKMDKLKQILILPGDGIGPEVCDEARKVLIHVNEVYNLGIIHKEAAVCLLYTSPSPRDATLSRMPSSA